jgi:hypothetical protein
LSSFYHKQLAQQAVVGLSGVEEVVNEVVVAPGDLKGDDP